ncbi:MAG: hypothetical protein ACTSQJ_06010, partial [Promethearchaeota archaeon]
CMSSPPKFVKRYFEPRRRILSDSEAFKSELKAPTLNRTGLNLKNKNKKKKKDLVRLPHR